ncbi:hypothetical protein [Endomicrobium proavitum]|uniref:Bacterial Ig-like domain-containing protein n=1 Tax=Endomicrobium proavitum TaxID=1408281 RepID=A0A0G3WII6_9BACT|nr:hypothetical protein [Endomicrobium proavitum]AKL97692.1 hypothetical protein Epro_0313 [Endomicrobium proavitum]
MAKKTKEKAAKTVLKSAASKKAKSVKKVSKKAKETKELAKISENKALSAAFLVIDYPVESDVLHGSHYAVRIGASPVGAVEVSFNSKDWNPCRFAAGFWWYDWTGFSKGSHIIEARLLDSQNKEVLKTSPRKFDVK